MPAEATAGPLKPGRKLDPTLPLTAARLAQRAFRARKAERQSSLLEQVASLQQRNDVLEARNTRLEQQQQQQLQLPSTPTYDHDQRPAPPSPGAALLPVVLASRFSLSDLQFITSFCPIPLPDIADPSPYIAFCLALIPSLPAPRLPPPLPASIKAEDQCCGGLIDCSGPLFDQEDSAAPLASAPAPRTFVGAPAAWMHLAQHRRSVDPRDLVAMIEQARRSTGAVAKCDAAGGLQVEEAAVMAVRQSLEDYAAIQQ